MFEWWCFEVDRGELFEGFVLIEELYSGVHWRHCRRGTPLNPNLRVVFRIVSAAQRCQSFFFSKLPNFKLLLCEKLSYYVRKLSGKIKSFRNTELLLTCVRKSVHTYISFIIVMGTNFKVFTCILCELWVTRVGDFWWRTKTEHSRVDVCSLGEHGATTWSKVLHRFSYDFENRLWSDVVLQMSVEV